MSIFKEQHKENKIEEKFKTQKLLADDKSIPVFTFGSLKNDAGIIGATLF